MAFPKTIIDQYYQVSENEYMYKKELEYLREMERRQYIESMHINPEQYSLENKVTKTIIRDDDGKPLMSITETKKSNKLLLLLGA